MRIGLGIGLNRFRGGQAGAAGVVGLLDSYKGSAFAMSPDTLLYSTYSATDDVAGSVTNGDTGQFSVTVYRDSDNAMRSFTPAEVADGTANTWREAAGAANGFVRRGYDQSVTALNVSNLNHADQESTPAMPKLFDSSTGLITEGGKAAMELDGVNNCLIVFNNTTPPTSFQGVGNNITYISVEKPIAITVNPNPPLIAPQNTVFELRENNSIDARTPISTGYLVGPNYKFGVTSNYTASSETFDFPINLSQKITTISILSNQAVVDENDTNKINTSITTANGDRSLRAINSTCSIGVRSRDNGAADVNYYHGKAQLIIFWPNDATSAKTEINNEYTIY